MKSTLISLNIPIEPHGKGRPKFTTRGGFGRAYTPKETAEWEKQVAGALRKAWDGGMVDGPVKVVVVAIKARPAYLEKPKVADGYLLRTQKPDSDNVLKSVLDALQQSGVIADDKQVVEVQAFSLYTFKGRAGCVIVEVSLVEREDVLRDIVQALDSHI